MTTLRDAATEPTVSADPRSRAERVAEAAARWADELAALGGRDPLLHFRDLKIGTLDLAAADSEFRRKLLDGEPVLVSRLFPHEPLRTSALRSARAVRDQARELAQERGIDTAMLAIGIATWANPFAAHRPSAPVLLRRASVIARDPAETDFMIEVAAELEINPVLLHALDTQLGLRFGPDDLRDGGGPLRYPVVVERLREFAPAHVVDGFSIAHRAVLGTFATEPLLASTDIATLAAELSSHDVVAALVGDSAAERKLRDAAGGPAVRPQHLVLEADAAQVDVVAAVASGRHLLVDAPPGTGRTQTVANAVAELVARGQRVLVVSPKRATLSDLIDRLAGAGLSDAVVDLVNPAPDAEVVRRVIDTAAQLPAGTARDRPETGTAQARDKQSGSSPRSAGDEPSGSIDRRPAGRPIGRLENTDRLRGYLDALHRRRDPWGCSAYDVMAAVALAAPEARSKARVPRKQLGRLTPGTREALRVKLRTYAELGGLTQASRESPWSGASVATGEEAAELRAAVAELQSTTLRGLRNMATRAAVEVGLPGPDTPAEAFETVRLLTEVAATLERFHPEIWTAPLDEYVAATGDRRWRVAEDVRLGPMARRRLCLQIRDLQTAPSERWPRGDLHGWLVAAREQLITWRDRARDPRPPRTGPHLHGAAVAAQAVRAQLSRLAAANPKAGDLAELPFAEVAARLNEFAADHEVLMALPKLAELGADLESAGLGDLLAALARRQADADLAEAAFAHTWQASALDLWRTDDPVLGRFDAATYERQLAEYRVADRAALEAAAAGVLAGRARRFAEEAASHEGQAAVVLESAQTGNLPRSLRELLAAAPDLTLAAAPVWVLPALAVATTLPPQRRFDVVIIEDAGRLTPAEAVPAIARADRVVLLASDEQLAQPPFSTAVEQLADTDDQPLPYDAFGNQDLVRPQSVADLLAAALPRLPLVNGYRTRDDRLVGHATGGLFRGRFTAFPGRGGPSRLSQELVRADGDGGVDSSEAEVRRVVELVFEHARVRPHESLGVVTLSRQHAVRVDAAIRAALIRSPDVAPFLRENREEPFFVKDVDRVAGDVRDAIILTLGYGRSVDGRVLYRFGALDRPGGDRRLAVAITASRERTTVVSSFGSDDLSPRRLTTAGGRALREFLAVAEESTTEPSAGGGDPLAIAVAERLRAAGASVVLGHGAGLGRIEVAVRHPLRRDRFVLAVETDGPAYATAASVRERDRTRPEQLARLGWSIHRVWSAAWAADPDGETTRLVDAYAKAVADADAYDWAVAAAEADVVAGVPQVGEKQPGESADSGRPAAGRAAEPADEADPASGDGAPDGPVPDQGRPALNGPAGAVDGPVEEAAETTGARPPLPRNRTIAAYTHPELAALARWAEAGRPSASEAAVVAELGADLRLIRRGPRSDDVLRHAVRVARAGAPDL
jgi:hypothetical protein